MDLPGPRIGLRGHAESSVKYFERIVRDYPAEIWYKALATAREWLRLARADVVSNAEMSALLGAVYGHCHGSTAWWDLAAGVYQWVQSIGGSVPSFEVLVAYEGVFFSTQQDKPSPT
jgi:hypothetical protein